MSLTKKIIIAVIILAGAGVIYYGVSPLFRNITVNDPLPQETSASEPSSEVEPRKRVSGEVRGPFPVTGTLGHPAEGNLRIFISEGKTIVRYENYKTINGPDLRIYLSKDLEAKEAVDIGAIKGTSGNINYEIPAGINISDYRYVLTWCVPFGVLFNYAEIK